MTITIETLVMITTLAWRWRPRPEHRHAEPKTSLAARARSPRRWLAPVLQVAGLVTLTALGGPVVSAVAIALVILRPRVAASRERRRQSEAIAAALPDFIDMLVLTVRAGCTPVHAFEILAETTELPLRRALRAVHHEITNGRRFADAVLVLPVLLGGLAQPLADSLALADRHGTPLAPLLDRLAEDARGQRRRNTEAAARQLPIRLSFPLVGCTLPAFVLLTIVPLMAGTLSSIKGLSP